MNNINIKNIFANNTLQNNPNTTVCIRDFSVNTLVESNTFGTSISDDYIIDKIKSNKKNKIDKINDLYKVKYKECLVQINNSIELNLTDTIFSVGVSYFGYDQYNSLQCIKYIQEKLKEKLFLTMILSHKDIFISWKNIN
jgi:hypothetical protein